MVLAVAYAVLALVLSGAKPGPAARPVGIYEPYDADGCDDCVCHGKALCEVRLSVAQEMKQPLMLQFQLDSFYQNHRRYLKSESYAQLARTPHEQQSSALDYEAAGPPRTRPAPHPPRTRPAPARAAPPHPHALTARAQSSARSSADGHRIRLVGPNPSPNPNPNPKPKPNPNQDLKDDCAPLVSPNGSSAAPPYDPCGVKAASLFNDYVQLFACADSSCTASELELVKTSKDIAYDFARSYRAWPNASALSTGRAQLYEAWRRAQAPPPSPPPAQPPLADLSSGVLDGLPEDSTPLAGFVVAEPELEDFVSWMRASPMATLRKPLLRIEQDLPAGEYVLHLANRYDVRTFRGAKSLRISAYTTSLGGDPGTLVIILIVLCVASLLLAAAVAAATCRSSQPARHEALLQELRSPEP